MNAPLLCQWLGLPNATWPPDPYTLLGLKPGEADAVALEHRVHERMARLRCYQISHPEEATEGMNRLAQAYITLSEACAAVPKAAPALPGKAAPLAPPQVKQRVGDDTAVILRTQVDWRDAPPPVRGRRADEAAGDTTPLPAAAPPSRVAPREDRESLRALAQQSLEATSGLGTLAAVAERIDMTRQLLVAWQALGGILSRSASKKPASPQDNVDLTRRVKQIDTLMQRFPEFLGQPGKPGYRVVALARLAMTYDMLKHFDAGQKADLMRDWDNGEKILLAHRCFLRLQFKSLRHAGVFAATMRAVHGFLNDHALYVGYALYVGLGVLLLAGAVVAIMMIW